VLDKPSTVISLSSWCKKLRYRAARSDPSLSPAIMTLTDHRLSNTSAVAGYVWSFAVVLPYRDAALPPVRYTRR
jgi:hypothetical protein